MKRPRWRLIGRRLHRLGHTIRMDHRRITHQALYWEVPGFKRGPDLPRTNWRGIVKKDLRGMGLTWEEAEVAALNRQEWRRSVAQYVYMDVGWIKSSQVKTLDWWHQRLDRTINSFVSDLLKTDNDAGSIDLWPRYWGTTCPQCSRSWQHNSRATLPTSSGFVLLHANFGPAEWICYTTIVLI